MVLSRAVWKKAGQRSISEVSPVEEEEGEAEERRFWRAEVSVGESFGDGKVRLRRRTGRMERFFFFFLACSLTAEPFAPFCFFAEGGSSPSVTDAEAVAEGVEGGMGGRGAARFFPLPCPPAMISTSSSEPASSSSFELMAAKMASLKTCCGRKAGSVKVGRGKRRRRRKCSFRYEKRWSWLV